MSWNWRYHDRDGNQVDSPDERRFSTQADAETWLGQVWPDLVDQGVTSVTLYEDGRAVYGPMSLEPDG
jgi:hypothetical protein